MALASDSWTVHLLSVHPPDHSEHIPRLQTLSHLKHGCDDSSMWPAGAHKVTLCSVHLPLQSHPKVTPWELCPRLYRLFGEKYYSLAAGNQQVSEDWSGWREEETSYPVRNSVLKRAHPKILNDPENNTKTGQRPTKASLGSC